MATAFRHGVRYTYADYLAFEATSNVKHEFLDGQIYAMAGGTPEHTALQAAVIGLLFSQLDGSPCRPHTSDLHVRVVATGLATYPDVTVIRGPTERDAQHPATVLNPTLIVEVLSDSTEDFDRNDKFENYKLIPSLRQYVLVSQREPSVEVWTRSDAGWDRTIAAAGDVADLGSISCKLEVSTLYARASLPNG